MKLLKTQLLSITAVLLAAVGYTRGHQGHVAPPMTPPANAEQAPLTPLIFALDANDDGVISEEELNDAVGALRVLDADGDGSLAPGEYRPRHRPLAPAFMARRPGMGRLAPPHPPMPRAMQRPGASNDAEEQTEGSGNLSAPDFDVLW